MQRSHKLTWKAYVLIGCIALMLMAVPIILRFVNHAPLLISDEPYLHLRAANHITQYGITRIPGMAVDKVSFPPSPYDLLLSIMIKPLGEGISSLILPMILGIISAVLLCYMTHKAKMPRMMVMLTTLLFISTPIFVYTSIVSDDGALLMMLQLLFFTLYPQKKIWSFATSILLSAGITLFGFAHLIIDIAYAIIVSVMLDKSAKRFVVYLFSNLFILGLVLPLINYEPTQLLISTKPNAHLITDFGSPVGVSIFLFVLGIIGAFIIARHQLILFCTGSIVCITALFSPIFYLYATLILSFFAAYAILFIMTRIWVLALVQRFTLLLIVCGILFSFVSYSTNLAASPPDQPMINALLALSLYSNEESVVLTSSSEELYVQSIAKRRTYTNRQESGQEELEKERIANAVFDSYNLNAASQILEQQGITHIYITPSMTNGEVWDAPNRGLALLVYNNETFKSSYESDGYGIWELRSSLR
ncbi:MAG: hypothetical protein AABX52_00760 [Nanoarchaeota archaeon]